MTNVVWLSSLEAALGLLHVNYFCGEVSGYYYLIKKYDSNYHSIMICENCPCNITNDGCYNYDIRKKEIIQYLIDQGYQDEVFEVLV